MATRDEGFTPGYGTWFKDGKLIEASATRILVLKPWGQRAIAVEKRKDRGWRSVQPHEIRFDAMQRFVSRYKLYPRVDSEPGSGQTLLPFVDFKGWLLRRQLDAFKSFLAEIPAPVLAMSTTFRRSQWQIKELANRVDGGDGSCGPVADLYQARKFFLMFVIANNYAFQRQYAPARMARKLIQMPHRQVAESLGFGAAGVCAERLFEKIPVLSVDLRFAHSLRRCLQTADGLTRKWLAHLPRLNQSALICLLPWLGLRPHVTWRFLTEVAQDAREDLWPRFPWLLRNALGRLQLLNSKQALKVKVNSKADLETMYEENLWPPADKVQPFDDLDYPHLWCPSGSALVRITPMQTSDQLLALAQDQRNCVGNYGLRIARGECYIYRVETPQETCTLSVVERNGEWTVGDVKGRWNLPPSVETLYWISSWLALNKGTGAAKFNDFYRDGIPV